MEKTKRTKKEIFGEMAKIFEEMKREDLVEFVKHELELLERKNSSKKGMSATQKENETIMNLLEKALTEETEPITITDLLTKNKELASYTTASGNNLTNQKVSALMKKLVEERKTVENIKEKRKSYFVIKK